MNYMPPGKPRRELANAFKYAGLAALALVAVGVSVLAIIR